MESQYQSETYATSAASDVHTKDNAAKHGVAKVCIFDSLDENGCILADIHVG
jgi:hypothetical protein